MIPIAVANSRSQRLMDEFKDFVPHTGGVLTIHKDGQRYLSYVTPMPSQVSAAFSGIRWNSRAYGPHRELLLPPVN
jgi:hypothetical protein